MIEHHELQQTNKQTNKPEVRPVAVPLSIIYLCDNVNCIYPTKPQIKTFKDIFISVSKLDLHQGIASQWRLRKKT